MLHQGVNRLKKDLLKLQADPIPNCKALPLSSNIYEWHFVIFGPADTDYEGGIYHGKLVFPHDYPFKPPAIYMLTPNGRFKTNTKLCLSISDFHPESWNPSWSVSSILHGLISFMTDDTTTLGSIETTKETKRRMAHDSWIRNLDDKLFCKLFPQIVEKYRRQTIPPPPLLHPPAIPHTDGSLEPKVALAKTAIKAKADSNLSYLYIIIVTVLLLVSYKLCELYVW